jgi:NAD(P)-dependent dehydrogenase (short-subunit alcohol dehydrogenase family)
MKFESLEGKVAIVSGASRGVGRAYALALAEAGAKVVALARSLEGDPKTLGNLAEVAATARAAGGEIAVFACDLLQDASIVEAVSKAVETYGGVDVVVNNAVWPVRGHKTLSVPEEEWVNAFKVNVQGPYAFMREAIPHMLQRGGGAIVNITTASAGFTRPGHGGHDGLLTYGVTKAAAEKLTTFFGANYESRNIAVNAVSPGHVASYMENSGDEPDVLYWGAPVVHLARQRPKEGGLSARILHTYGYGRSWGPRPATPPQLNENILAMLDRYGSDADAYE